MAILHAGDTIGLIAPSAGLSHKSLDAALQYFGKLGLKVKTALNAGAEYRYMAGTDVERAKEINRMFDDPEVKALFCIRGGAGATRMLGLLDYELIKKHPKPVIGLSDSTALQNAVFARAGCSSLTGFLPLYDFQSGEGDARTLSSLEAALFDDKQCVASGRCLIPGEAEGEIVGGCLSVFCYLCGTPYFPDLSGKILLLEDTSEKTYKIDLMFNMLKQQNNFDKLKGIVLGSFTDCIMASEEDGSIEDCIEDFVSGLKIPVVADFSYGHIKSRHVLPIGKNVSLRASASGCELSWQSNAAGC